jgi:hypothetical protein
VRLVIAEAVTVRHRPGAGVEVMGLAGDLDELGGVGEPEVVDGDALRVRRSRRPCPRSWVRSSTGTSCQGRRAQRASSVGSLGLDGEQVVGLLAGHEELGRVGVGVQRVGGHDHAGKVQPVQQG